MNNQCAICGQEMKLIPAGVSKVTGRPYQAFFACADKTHKQPRAGQTMPTPVQNFGSGLDKMNEDKKWQDSSRGKVRHGFAIEAYKLGLPLDVTTASQINSWTEYVMTGKLAQTGEPTYEQ